MTLIIADKIAFWQQISKSLKTTSSLTCLANDTFINEQHPYVDDEHETQVFIQKMTNLLDYLLEEYDKEGKTHVVIGIGCTGGQHRSVSLTNYFADHNSQKYQDRKSVV